MRKHNLDFSLVPDLSRSAVFYTMSDGLAARLRAFPEAYDRAWGTLHLGYNISGDETTLRTHAENLMRAREAHLRAALSEFVGMEAALTRDLVRRHDGRTAIKSSDTANPLPHIIRELRNLELHLHSSTMSVLEGTASWQPPDTPDREEFPHHSWYIDNVGREALASLRNASLYHPAELRQLVDWFNEAQSVWGVAELIRLAVEDYGGRIVQTYAAQEEQAP